MWPQEFAITWREAGVVSLAAVLVYAALILFSRLVGPRSFAQMTAFDFAVTVALGAIVGATATDTARLPYGVIGLAVLFALRWIVAVGRQHGLNIVVDNTPLLVMLGSEILQEHLERAKLTEADLRQSLRQSGITRLEQVEAVVMERDGSISVLRSDLPVDPYLLRGVAGYEAFSTSRTNRKTNSS